MRNWAHLQHYPDSCLLLRRRKKASFSTSLLSFNFTYNSLVGQQAVTSPFPVAWQCEVEGQQDPFPHDWVPEGHVEDCKDQPWPATARFWREETTAETAGAARVPATIKETRALIVARKWQMIQLNECRPKSSQELAIYVTSLPSLQTFRLI